MVKPVN